MSLFSPEDSNHCFDPRQGDRFLSNGDSDRLYGLLSPSSGRMLKNRRPVPRPTIPLRHRYKEFSETLLGNAPAAGP